MFENMVDTINDLGIDDEKKKELYKAFIDVLEELECDILYECSGLDHTFDLVINDYYGLDQDK